MTLTVTCAGGITEVYEPAFVTCVDGELVVVLDGDIQRLPLTNILTWEIDDGV